VRILKEDSSITQVILTSNWIELPWRIEGKSQRGLQAMSSALTKLIKETSAPDRRFLLIGTVPRLPPEVVECAVRNSSKLLRRPCVAAVQFSDALNVKRASTPTDGMLMEVAKSLPNVAAIIPTEKMCRDDACDVFLDGEFLYRDPGHIRRNLRLQTKKDFADRIGLTAALAGAHQDAARPDVAGVEAR
jgi:SGNH domain (fused to AT3 domains)